MTLRGSRIENLDELWCLGASGIFSKITFLKSVRSKKKDEVCHSFLVKTFTKSLHRGGVLGVPCILYIVYIKGPKCGKNCFYFKIRKHVCKLNVLAT